MSMEEKLQAKSYQCLNSNVLKLIGILLMIFDHLHQMFYMFGAPMWFTMLGRVVAPIFLFMASEGFYYTKNRKKYMLRLLIGFWVMGIASMAIQKQFPLEDVMLMNSIFGTLFLCVYYMWIVDFLRNGIKQRKTMQIVLSILGLILPFALGLLLFALINVNITLFQIFMILVPTFVTVEGGFVFILLAVAFYLLRKNRWLQVLALEIVAVYTFFAGNDIQWIMGFAAIPILLYNQKPGKKSTFHKYFFYLFYPAHIYLFYLISYYLH